MTPAAPGLTIPPTAPPILDDTETMFGPGPAPGVPWAIGASSPFPQIVRVSQRLRVLDMNQLY
jgi:hypothetical protein